MMISLFFSFLQTKLSFVSVSNSDKIYRINMQFSKQMSLIILHCHISSDQFFLFTNKGRERIWSKCQFIVESTQHFTANLLVIKYSLSERFWVTYTRNTEDRSWHALRERYYISSLFFKQMIRVENHASRLPMFSCISSKNFSQKHSKLETC